MECPKCGLGNPHLTSSTPSSAPACRHLPRSRTPLDIPYGSRPQCHCPCEVGPRRRAPMSPIPSGGPAPKSACNGGPCQSAAVGESRHFGHRSPTLARPPHAVGRFPLLCMVVERSPRENTGTLRATRWCPGIVPRVRGFVSAIYRRVRPGRQQPVQGASTAGWVEPASPAAPVLAAAPNWCSDGLPRPELPQRPWLTPAEPQISSQLPDHRTESHAEVGIPVPRHRVPSVGGRERLRTSVCGRPSGDRLTHCVITGAGLGRSCSRRHRDRCRQRPSRSHPALSAWRPGHHRNVEGDDHAA